jgi:hypothetical protein
MYCPKCSQQQASDNVRFCSRCGFQLNVIKELLASDSTPKPITKEGPDSTAISRQRNVNLGAMLMLVGAALAAASSGFVAGPPTVVIGATLLVFTAAFILVILFSRPLMRAIYKLSLGEDQTNTDLFPLPSDINLGAVMMFTVTLVLVFAFLFWGVDNATRVLLVSIVSFVFTLLLSKYLAQGFPKFVSEEAIGVNSVSQVTPARDAGLPPMQSIPIELFNSRRLNTAEMVQPESITEHTTTLLDKP